MKLSEIKVEYVDHMGSDITPVNAARISFNSSTEELTPRDEKLIKYLADHNHMTPFEHQMLTVIVHCPMYVRSQIHRHRTFAFNEVSRRYTTEDLSFYIPPVDDIREQSKSNKQGSGGALEEAIAEATRSHMLHLCEESLNTFHYLTATGVAREQARAVLPQALMTKFYMTGNLRNWVHFLGLRLDPHAHKEVRVVAEQVLAMVQEQWPVSSKALMESK